MDEKKQRFGTEGGRSFSDPLPPKLFFHPEKPLDDVSTLSGESLRECSSPSPVYNVKDVHSPVTLSPPPPPRAHSLPLPSNVASDSHLVKDVGEEPKTEPRVGKRKRILRHCGRFWPCYIITIIVFLAIFLPLLFVKIIPAIAQSMVDGMDIPLHNTTLQLASSDKVVVGINTVLNMPGGVKASLDNFTLFLYNPGTPDGFYPYLNLSMPAMTVDGNTALDLPQQTAQITNVTEVTRFLNQTVSSDTAQIGIRGNTTAHLGVLQFPIWLDKTVTLAALAGLPGVAIDDISLKLPPAPDGTNMHGNITIPNPSGLSLDLGRVTFNILAGDAALGVVTIAPLRLPAGADAHLPFTGTLFVDAALASLGPLMQQQAGLLASGRVALNVSGNATVVDGQHVRYLEHVLADVRIPTEVPVMQLVGELIHGVLGGGDPDGNGDDDGNPLSLRGLLDALKNATGGEVTGEIGKIGSKLTELVGDFINNLNITEALGESLLDVAKDG